MATSGPLARLSGLFGARDPDAHSSALDDLPLAVIEVDSYGRPQHGNRAAHTLTASAGGLAEWLYDAPFHDPDSRSLLRPADKPLARFLAEPELEEVFAALFEAEGAEQVLRFTRTALTGAPGSLLVCIEDGSALWHLRRSNGGADRLESIGQLSGGIAHDMANLLGVIRLSADALALSSEKAGTSLPAVTAIQAACDQGSALIDHLLSLARREDGTRTRIDLAPFLEALGDLIRRTIPAHIRIEIALSTPDMHVTCDRGGLEHALLNLAINAQKALQESGATEGLIRISATPAQEEGSLCLTVSDDGPGMQPAVLARATEAFFSTRGAEGGSGLGLAMVSTFAESSGGGIHIDSTPDSGTRVSLTLPCDAPADLPSESEPETVSLEGVTLLVVEDDPLFGEVLTQALGMLGATVTLATEAEPALAAAETLTPDLLITDIVLPGPMNGHQLALRLRQRFPDLRVIYVSGYAAPSSLPGDYVPGAFLRKPVSAATMANTIARCLESDDG